MTPDGEARIAASAACGFIADGDLEAANSVLTIYMAEHGQFPMLAMMMLNSALMALAVVVADGPEVFRELSARLVSNGGVW